MSSPAASRASRIGRGLAALVAAVLVGVGSGAAATVLHARWWGLALGLVTALVVLAWLPAGGVRLGFALGWCVPVLRGALPRPDGGYLVAADAPGWSLLGASAVLLVAAAVSLGAGSRSPVSGRRAASGDGTNLGEPS